MNHIINHSPKGYQKIQKIKDELLPLQNFPSSLLFSTLYLLGILLLSLCIHLFFGLADVSQSFEKVYSAMKRFRGEFLKRSEGRWQASSTTSSISALGYIYEQGHGFLIKHFLFCFSKASSRDEYRRRKKMTRKQRPSSLSSKRSILTLW